MQNGLAGFASRWVYDTRRVLERHLEGLKDDLASDDDGIREKASEQAIQILDWLHPPLPPPSNAERLQGVQAVIADETLSATEKLAAVQRAGRSTGRRRGRPRTETAQLAIRALSLHYATPMSWREIALAVKGCKHKRPNPERSCHACGDAIRDAAGRLESFLISIGHDLDFTRGRDLDEKTQAQLLELWQPKE
jgi:hypothetical protein